MSSKSAPNPLSKPVLKTTPKNNGFKQRIVKLYSTHFEHRFLLTFFWQFSCWFLDTENVPLYGPDLSWELGMTIEDTEEEFTV